MLLSSHTGPPRGPTTRSLRGKSPSKQKSLESRALDWVDCLLMPAKMGNSCLSNSKLTFNNFGRANLIIAEWVQSLAIAKLCNNDARHGSKREVATSELNGAYSVLKINSHTILFRFDQSVTSSRPKGKFISDRI